MGVITRTDSAAVPVKTTWPIVCPRSGSSELGPTNAVWSFGLHTGSRRATHVDASMDVLRDRGSIPRASTRSIGTPQSAQHATSQKPEGSVGSRHVQIVADDFYELPDMRP